MVLPSHPSHRKCFPSSDASGSVPSLHTRWTTLGVERHVDLWTKRPSVHSVRAATTEDPAPGWGRGPRIKNPLPPPLARPRRGPAGGTRVLAPAHRHDEAGDHGAETDREVPRR